MTCGGMTDRALFSRFCKSHRFLSPSVLDRTYVCEYKLEDVEELAEAMELDDSSDTPDKNLRSGDGSNEYDVGGRFL